MTRNSSRQLQTCHRIRPRHHLHSVVELVAKHHVIIVDNGAALNSSKLKPRLTTCPTRRSALESVAPVSHEPGRHVRGELRQQPPSAVGGVVEHERPVSRAATLAQLHTPAATFPVASLWMCTTASHLSVIHDNEQGRLHCSCRADGGSQQCHGAIARRKIVIFTKILNNNHQ